MDSQEQAAGEKRVRMLLIEALERRGLVKPASLTKVQYADMTKDLCQRLAYMSELSLMALEEQVAANPAGKDRDRLPIGNKILEWAGQIQPPEHGASPLMRAVFGHALGQNAVAEGWAPELLEYLSSKRLWPNSYAVMKIKEQADGSVRRLTIMEERMAGGVELSREDGAWRDRRLAQIRKCRDIAEMAQAGDLA
ncbi:hypothetical protein D2T31_04920 [Sinirhodobacter populi]|uniref:Uncharacterized protein n=1 Tax=Paenirhodobacter populi TaxID=2306993 RepID=A0A443KEV4_9RHOB|nr:hypothetical protein [Sinirhodobacter populi]RWR31344.1 hypothetical protein D2T31_04920 [Sinirhodobacter populi]